MKVLVNDQIDEEAVNLLRANGLVVDVKEYSQEELVKKIVDYDILIVRSRTKVDRPIINSGKKLKIIARAGAGLDNIDLDAAKEKNIAIVNSPGAPSEAVCELVFALLLSLSRQLCRASQKLKSGEWVKKQLQGFELKGKNLLIIGYGRIGRLVALRAKAFEMNVYVYDSLQEALGKAKADGFSVYGPGKDQLLTALNIADIITIHVPLINETRNLIAAEEFAHMKKGVFIINTSRGGIINERDLLENLNKGKVAGAGLDVYEIEPPLSGFSRELANHPNTICTPHIGAATAEAQSKAGMIIVEKIIKLITSKTIC